jgi:hypothetical protein
VDTKPGGEASDAPSWRRRLTALARLLESVEKRNVDWHKSRHIKEALKEIHAIPHPEFEISMSVEMAAGWLAHLIRAIALDEKANPGQTQIIFNAVRELMKNAGYALAAQQVIENARKQSNKDQTRSATKTRITLSAQVDEILWRCASKYRRDDGWERGTPRKIEKIVNKYIDKLNEERRSAHESEMAKLPMKRRKDFRPIPNLGADAISRRLTKADGRTIIQEKTRMNVRPSLNCEASL